MLARVLRRLAENCGTADGLAGWTDDHIRQAAWASVEAMEATLEVIKLILSGDLPRHSKLLDSALIGLRKPDGVVRSIAIGEVKYRVAALCANEACASIDAAPTPLQLGVGVSGGVEAAGHVLFSALAEHDHAMALLDVENAFNTVGRAVVFAAVQHHAPQLLTFVQ